MMQAAMGLSGLAAVAGLAIYALVLARKNGNLRVAVVELKVLNITSRGELDLARDDLRAHKRLLEKLEKEEHVCAIDPKTAERMPPGSVRALIDRELSANPDGVRSDIIDELPGFDEDSETWDNS